MKRPSQLSVTVYHQDNTSCQHQATTSSRKITYVAKDVGSFNLFYCEQRDKSLVPSFPGHFFSSVSLFFILLYLPIFLPSFYYCWQCHLGTEPQLIHSLECTQFCALPLILAHLSRESNPTHWETLNAGLKCSCCFTAHKSVADAFFWSFTHIT